MFYYFKQVAIKNYQNHNLTNQNLLLLMRNSKLKNLTNKIVQATKRKIR